MNDVSYQSDDLSQIQVASPDQYATHQVQVTGMKVDIGIKRNQLPPKLRKNNAQVQEPDDEYRLIDITS